MKIKQLHLVQRPDGPPTEENFCCREVELPALREGQALIENMWMSVDPYMRPRMTGIKTYIDPYQPGLPMDGGAVGRVVASKSDLLAEGDYVFSMHGWRTGFTALNVEIDVLGDAEAVQWHVSFDRVTASGSVILANRPSAGIAEIGGQEGAGAIPFLCFHQDDLRGRTCLDCHGQQQFDTIGDGDAVVEP